MGSVAVGLNLTGAAIQHLVLGQFFHPDASGHTRSGAVIPMRAGTRAAGRRAGGICFRSLVLDSQLTLWRSQIRHSPEAPSE